MKDMVYRQAAIDELKKYIAVNKNPNHDARIWEEGMNCAITVIGALPSAEPEAKPPKWVAEDRYIKNHFKIFPHCPQCNAEVTTGQYYCMICGQHIDWSEDDG